MSRLFTNVLDKRGKVIFEKLGGLQEKDWLLGGGTALALQLNHRKSFDFDIFLVGQVPRGLLLRINQSLKDFKIRPLVDTSDELSVSLEGEKKLTFLKFPFPPLHNPLKTHRLKMFSLADLASNKAYVVGRRGEWKDYVDLYFLLKRATLSLKTIIGEAKKRFGGNFDEKLFWQQLVYWKDLRDFKIDYIGKQTSSQTIKQYFQKLALKRFSVLL